MARAKNTERAAARRRSRAARAAALAATEEAPAAQEEAAPPEPARLRPALRLPNLREDLRAFPGMFRTRRLLWLPFIMLIVAFLLGLANIYEVLPEALAQPAVFFVQLALPPAALFVFFIGGFLAPRASYLVGFVLGLIDGPLYAIAGYLAALRETQLAGMPPPSDRDLLSLFVQSTAIAVIFGTLGAAFAAWYRDFLRQSAERARANRLAREEKQRAERKQAEREARRSASGRTTSP